MALCVAIYYMQNCVFLYLLLLLHQIGNVLAYVAALLVASFLGIKAFVVSASDSILLGRRFEFDTLPSFCLFEVYFYFLLCHLIEQLFGLVFASVCEVQLGLCVV